jgi:hypothetical protein
MPSSTTSSNGRQGAYSYYSFPPTPNRSSPQASSKASSPETVRSFHSRPGTSKKMAPTPAAGRKESSEPQTPTKSGKKPESSSTQKLTGGTASARKPPKLGSAKTPKQTPKAGKEAEQKGKEASGKIDMKDNDAPSEAGGKVSQAGDQTSVADTSDLSEADPQPVPDSDEDETVAGARDTVDKAAKDEGKSSKFPNYRRSISATSPIFNLWRSRKRSNPKDQPQSSGLGMLQKTKSTPRLTFAPRHRRRRRPRPHPRRH